MSENLEITPPDNRPDLAPFLTIWRLVSRFMVPVVMIVFAAPFVTLLFYSVPAADDFCNASLSFNTVPQRDVLSLTWLYYTQWSPRWLTTIFFAFSMSHVDLIRGYGWLLLLVAITNVAALWYFFSTFFSVSRRASLLMATVFYSAWVASLTSPDQQLYWLTNVIVYNLPLSTLLVLVSLLQRRRTAVWYYVVVALLSVAVPAQHEIAGTFLCGILLAGIVAMRIRKAPASQWYLSIGMATASLATVMLSPGNAARAAAEHRHLWDIAHFPHWVGHSFYHGINWLSAPAILVAACCILLLYRDDLEMQAREGRPPRWLGVASLYAIFVLLSESALTEVATSSWLPDRVVAWFQFVFWLLFVCVVVAGVPEVHRIRVSLATRVGVSILLAVMLLGSTNFREAVADVRGPAQGWWRTQTARLRQRGGSLEYTAPASYPSLAKPQMLTNDPGCWVNECLANYLHANSVVVNNSKDECPH
ncbi:MAG: hypothetical protein LAO30_17470 [Acidobacteriia bacterium]|nr:hypothetical protein [Terriglobia bacterium]